MGKFVKITDTDELYEVGDLSTNRIYKQQEDYLIRVRPNIESGTSRSECEC